MLERSRFLGRLIGLYLLLVGVAMLLHRQTSLEAVAGVLRNPAMTLTLGLVTLAAALPPGMEAELLMQELHDPALFYPYRAIDLLLGGCLTYSGFAAK